jgi:hypothetical protein
LWRAERKIDILLKEAHVSLIASRNGCLFSARYVFSNTGSDVVPWVNLSTSDHRPVLLSFNAHFEPAERNPTFNYSAANWDLYQSGIVNYLNTQYLDGSCSTDEIDVAVTHLTNIVCHTCSHSEKK